MATLRLPVNKRQKEEKNNLLRKEKQVPCVIYGNIENTPLKCDALAFHKVYAKAGENTVIELELDGKNIPVLIHSIDLDPVSDIYEHIDFYALDMSKEVTTHVPVRFTGEAPAVKDQGAILVTVNGELTVTCLPKDLPKEFMIDISTLMNFHDTITVASIAVPAGVTIKEASETIIVMVQEPRAIEVEEPVAAAPAEGEAAAGAEGATPAEGSPGAEGDKK